MKTFACGVGDEDCATTCAAIGAQKRKTRLAPQRRVNGLRTKSRTDAMMELAHVISRWVGGTFM
ncbi:MAG TPA: hypothetical protein VLL54_12110 [Pyrinomonadaceae bacterium]|nr:hypothetical protein [Pyrinomonadaceae bacterium]